MKLFVLKANARKRNAIGVFYPITFHVEANSVDEAWSKVIYDSKYELYQKISEKEFQNTEKSG